LEHCIDDDYQEDEDVKVRVHGHIKEEFDDGALVVRVIQIHDQALWSK